MLRVNITLEVIKLIIHKKYDVDEGCLVLLNILENLFISECVSVPRKIYKEIEKLYDLLVEYLVGNYLNVEMIDTKLVQEVTFKVFTNKEISNNYKKSYQKSKS